MGGVVALGMFDGVHLGHQKVIGDARAMAQRLGVPLSVMTFSSHPLAVIAPERVPPVITDEAERSALFSELGVDYLMELDFNEAFSRMSPSDFIDMLSETMRPRAVVVGPNYSFGTGGRGTPEMLRDVGERLGFDVVVSSAVFVGAEMVSSTRVRRSLAAGDVSDVTACLGRPFSVNGVVCHGDERGRTIDFPTANIELSDGRAMLADGAYAVRVTIESGQYKGSRHDGMANIGYNPTFGASSKRLETHLFDFSGNIYGEKMTVSFVERLRGEVKFSSIEALCDELQKDKLIARKILDERDD